MKILLMLFLITNMVTSRTIYDCTDDMIEYVTVLKEDVKCGYTPELYSQVIYKTDTCDVVETYINFTDRDIIKIEKLLTNKFFKFMLWKKHVRIYKNNGKYKYRVRTWYR